MKMIDAHIHLDHYTDMEMRRIIIDSHDIEALISVSFHLESCKKNLLLAREYEKVKPAFGYHPEQVIPTDHVISELFNWMEEHVGEMVAVGEVGLPYYLRQEQRLELAPYLELLEEFIRVSKKWGKPIVLHAVYDDAPLVCDLLEKYSVSDAHFHWFKGDMRTVERMISNGYHISVTPDVVYEQEIQELVLRYPIEQIMIETDGPWPFEGPFLGKMTHPNMMKESVESIARIKGISVMEASKNLLFNTKRFYRI